MKILISQRERCFFSVRCRDDRPVVDSGCGIKRNVPFTNRTGSTMNVNFEVTDTKRAILFVHKGCGNGSMIVFTPDGKGKIVNDTACFEQVKQIMAGTPGFDIVYDRGADVLDVDVNDGFYVNDERRKFESDSGISFP